MRTLPSLNVDPTNDRIASLISAAHQATLDLFASISDAAAAVIASNSDWAESGRRDGQYSVDLDVDAVCVGPLLAAGYDVLSEESGIQRIDDSDGRSIVVCDPLDGSTNASLGLPWCATALCHVVGGQPQVAMVTNLVTGDRYTAVKDSGATRNGHPILVGAPTPLGEAIVAMNGLPAGHWGWRQFRAMGAAALDIAAVARGGFDGFVDTTTDSHGVWDYLASVLILEEAGGVAVDAAGRDLTVLEHEARRTPIVASNRVLLDELLAARSR
jgi:myo-inositol-1(or 4)-monophosphatase